MAASRRKGTKECPTRAILACSARAGQPATRTSGRRPKKKRAPIYAASPNATPAQTPQVYAIRSRQAWQLASKSWDWRPGGRTSSWEAIEEMDSRRHGPAISEVPEGAGAPEHPATAKEERRPPAAGAAPYE